MATMDKNKVVEILLYYRNIDGAIRLYRETLDDLESYYDTIKGQNMDGMPHGSGGTGNPVESTVLNLPPDLRENIDFYNGKINELHRLKVEVLKEVSGLEHRMACIVMDYYLHGLKWEQVSVRNHYSERQCKNIRNTAIDNLAQKFGKNAIIAGFEISA